MRRSASMIMLVVACSKHEPPLPTLENPPAPPPPAQKSPVRALPPVAPGEIRVKALDVDLVAPPGTTTFDRVDGTQLSWNGCSIEVTAQSVTGEPRTHHRVGTLDIDCVAYSRDPQTPPDRNCLAICDHMHAVPGGTAEEHYPTEPPVVEYTRSGGEAGGEGGIRLWSDGTTQYYGSLCPLWRAARSQRPRADVETLLRELDAGGFFAYPFDEAKLPHCPDAYVHSIIVRKDGREHEIGFESCSSQGLLSFGERLSTALGANPCF